MRKVIIGLSILFSSIAHAEGQQNKLFDCMDAKSFEVNSQCMEAKISQNMQFRDMQQQIATKTSFGGDNVMATMRFFPEQMLIEVVAHRDALTEANLTAMNRKSN